MFIKLSRIKKEKFSRIKKIKASPAILKGYLKVTSSSSLADTFLDMSVSEHNSKV